MHSQKKTQNNNSAESRESMQMLDRHATRRSQNCKTGRQYIGFIITLILPSIQVTPINHRTGRVERLWPTAFMCSYASLSQLPPSSSPKPHHGLHSPPGWRVVLALTSSKLIFKTKIVSSLQQSTTSCVYDSYLV